MCCLTVQRPKACYAQGAHTVAKGRPTPATRRLADCVLRGHGLLGALRPPNEHVLGLRGERLLHEDIALGLGILLEREGGREKVAAGKRGRCLAYNLLRIREVAGGSIWLESVGSRDGYTVGLHIDEKVSRATRTLYTNLSLSSTLGLHAGGDDRILALLVQSD